MHEKPPTILTRTITGLCWSFAAILLLTLPARLLDGQAWPLAMLSNFAPTLTLAAAALIGAVAGLRRWIPALLLLLAFLVHLAWLTAGRAPAAPPGATPDISVMSFNVRATNRDTEACLELLRSAPADVVVLIECSHRLAEAVAADADLDAAFPHRALPTLEHQWNGAILSRFPIELIPLRDHLREAGRRDELQRYRFQFLFQRAFVVHAPRGDAIVSGLWLTSPRTPQRWRDGNARLRLNAEIVNTFLAPTGLPLLIACDLNATPPAWRSRALREQCGLRRAKPLLRPGTWPADAHPLLRVAIDDLLVSQGVRVVDWRVLEDPAGSDHLPVIVTLDLPDGRPAPATHLNQHPPENTP